MTRLARTAIGVYAYALFLLVVAAGTAWFTVTGFIVGLARYPGLGALGASAALTAYYAVHPHRIPTSLRSQP